MAEAQVLACALGWLLWSLLVGGVANRLPAAWLARDSWFTRPRAWGERADAYERQLAIRQWKRWLPDAGPALPAGVRKAALVRPDRAALQRLCAETRRAELVHLALWPFWLVTALWLPPLGVLLNLLFATVFNLPCLWVQRYNRLRLQALLQRMGRGRSTAAA
jgi:glycosyl-4,4'-diaponeurosporenoate acyltransferase